MTFTVLDVQPMSLGTHTTLDVDGRTVEVWEPQDGASGPRPLLLAHDGQNLFLPGRSFGGVPWGLDAALATLPAGTVLPYVVAPWNRPGHGRAADYTPQSIVENDAEVRAGFFDYIARATGSMPSEVPSLNGDAYAQWCAESLIPAVVASLDWHVDPTAVAVMGSSMGGLASAYALALRPDVYSAALCLSTHWLLGGHALARQLTQMLPAAQRGARVWFDHGTLNLDATYGPFQETADAVMRERGYREPAQWRTTVYADADHNEASWATRLPEVLRWWLCGGEQA
ncbi:MAG: hypothetical protein KGP01_02345 [Actinomycetales bacterium]|nr:hypothetical protein [Actinomycetales bacterium]